ncbi:unnamed protein product [Hermetia illucens]|uniref:Uncharacterized protein n=2 Tax=Hermetia illucens TaxID=343691 RepID=A0A7R8UPI0_HERIL|nr:unnamed protein product [Hermetia illucens]
MFCPAKFCILLFAVKFASGLEFEEFIRWKQVAYESIPDASYLTPDFVFPEYAAVPGDDSYIPYNNVPQGVNHYKGRLFITMPRRSPGVPSTLNYIDLKQTKAGDSPRLKSYPNAEINSLRSTLKPGQKRLISVYRTRLDPCHRLWFVDTGMLEYPNNRTQVQRPSIWIMNLLTDEVISRYEVPESIVVEGRGLVSITPDITKGKCDEAYGYIPDLVQPALHVYSLKDNRMWTFRHNYFYFDPQSGDYNIAGQQFQWRDGIFSITLGDENKEGFRDAYFHPLSSTSEFAVSTKVLRNETNARRPHQGEDFKLLGARGKDMESSVHVYDPHTKVLFYAQIALSGIGCWNTQKRFASQNHHLIHQNLQTMIYPSDITVDMDGTLWAMTNSMPVFIYSKLDTNQYNFRVWRQEAGKAIQGTGCAL